MRQNVYYGRTSTSRRASLVNRLALAGVLSALLPAPATAGEMVTVAASPTESQHMRSVTMSIIPEVQFTPFPIERGQAERVWGSGFVPDLPCEVLSDAAITQPTCTTNDTGEVAGSFVAPATAGVLTVLVCQGGCKTAQAGGFDLQLVDARPEITIQPEQARPGDAVQLHGLDFLPGGVDVFALGSRSTVDDAPWGEFRLKLVVPRDITIGRQTVRACSGKACASRTFLVLPPATSSTASATPSPSPSRSPSPTPSPSRTQPSSAAPSSTATHFSTAAPSSAPTQSTGGVPSSTATPSPATPSTAAGSTNRRPWPPGPAIMVAAILLTAAVAFLAHPLSRRDRSRRWTRRHVTTRVAAGAPLTASLAVPASGSRRIRIRPHMDLGQQTLEEVPR